MFKRRVDNSGKSTLFQYAFKIFFVHMINIIIMFLFLAVVTSFNTDGLVMSDTAIYIILTSICFVFYLVAVYIESWRTGERDYNLVLYKRIEYNKLKSLYAALASQIPGIILALLLLLPLENNFSIQRFARYFYMNFIYPIMILDDSYSFKLVYFVPVIFAVLPSVSGYFMGYRGKRVLDRLMFIKPGDKKRQNLR